MKKKTDSLVLSQSWSSFVRIVIILFLLTTLTGCLVGGIATHQMNAVVQTFVLPAPKDDIINILTDVGRSLGFAPYCVKDRAGVIGSCIDEQLAKRPLSDGVMGYVNMNNLSIAKSTTYIGSSDVIVFFIKNDAKTIEVVCVASGSYGSGSKESGDELIKKFKSELGKR